MSDAMKITHRFYPISILFAVSVMGNVFPGTSFAGGGCFGKADPNQLNQFGETPLLIAVSKGDVKAVQKLINAGAILNIPSQNGVTPLALATHRVSDSAQISQECRNRYQDILEMLNLAGISAPSADLKMDDTNSAVVHVSTSFGTQVSIRCLLVQSEAEQKEPHFETADVQNIAEQAQSVRGQEQKNTSSDSLGNRSEPFLLEEVVYPALGNSVRWWY